MGWFERYGIPGAYFLFDSLLWILLLVPKIRFYVLSDGKHDYVPVLGALLALSALPFGYILTIVQQYFYLHKKKAGMYRRALEDYRQKVDKSHDEAAIEATVFCKLHFVDEDGYSPHDLGDNIKFIRTWIERRMDVLVINRALRWATVIAFFSSLILSAIYWSFDIIAGMFPLVFSSIVFLCLLKSTITIENQLVKVLSQFYQKNKIRYP